MIRSNRPASLMAFLSIALIGSASGDVISSPRTATSLPVVSPSEVSRSGDLLDVSQAIAGFHAEDSPLLRHAEGTGLAGSSLNARDTSAATPVTIARPDLPRETLIGVATQRIAPENPRRNPELASNPYLGHNVRIPEPASLTLLAAGLIGLLARRRMRQAIHPKKVLTVEAN